MLYESLHEFEEFVFVGSTMALFNKATVILLIVAFAMVISTTEASVRVGPCDQVCSRINAEKDECCRAHGYSSHAHCSGGMHCN
ncbi:unnamed protein product [Phaedon cochleariae]|uniref:Uncharacterized protein n=1 Tax=Phaedon cochleariae TaxID=80249 RepID=A0A9N9X561_PHACE|nr:unnamed protein product [Phaedon cochleariae]